MSPFNFHIKIAALISLLLLISLDVGAQKTRPKTPHKTPAHTKVPVNESRPSAVKYEVRVGPDGKMSIAVLSGLEGQIISADQIRKALADYLPEDPAHHREPISPMVVIRPDKDTKLISVIEAAQASRVSATANVSVITPDGFSLSVRPDPKFIDELDIKPNPLLLVLELRGDGHLYLNNEDKGSLNEPLKMISQLTDIFKYREENGVYRPDSVEVEKTVHILAPSDARFQRVMDIVKVLNEASAGPLLLGVDGEAEFGVRKELIQ